MIVKMDNPPRASAGDMIHLTADAGNIHCFDAASGLSISPRRKRIRPSLLAGDRRSP